MDCANACTAYQCQFYNLWDIVAKREESENLGVESNYNALKQERFYNKLLLISKIVLLGLYLWTFRFREEIFLSWSIVFKV